MSGTSFNVTLFTSFQTNILFAWRSLKEGREVTNNTKLWWRCRCALPFDGDRGLHALNVGRNRHFKFGDNHHNFWAAFGFFEANFLYSWYHLRTNLFQKTKSVFFCRAVVLIPFFVKFVNFLLQQNK